MAYVSTKCLARGRHTDCVTGPFYRNGDKVIPKTHGDICACMCHHLPGATVEIFDRQKMDYHDVEHYWREIK